MAGIGLFSLLSTLFVLCRDEKMKINVQIIDPSITYWRTQATPPMLFLRALYIPRVLLFSDSWTSSFRF